MLLQAAADFNIDLSASYMVGDGENDVECGKAAGCTPVLLTGETRTDVRCCPTLLDFVNETF